MVPPVQDAIDLLLPDADEAQRDHARKVTTFLRLLANDARAAHALTVEVDLGRARGELDGEDRRRLRSALEDLLRSHLQAAAGPASFLWCGEVQLDPRRAWSVLEELRAELPWLAGVPLPGEPAASVAARLLASLERLDPPAASGADGGDAGDELGLWRARLELARGEARAAERSFRRELARPRGGAGRPARDAADPARCAALSRAAAAGVVECLLERGAVGEARALLEQHGCARAKPAGADARLRALAAWTQLCAGDFDGAKRALVGLAPWSGPLPAALCELRARRPEWLPCLAGRCAPEPAADAGPAEAERAAGAARADLGACALVVFAFRAGDGAVPVHADVAPGLRGALPAWLADREGACTVPSAPEHRLVVRAQGGVVHREGERAPEGALGASTCALARVAVLSASRSAAAGTGAGVAGWVHVEFEHHLVPCRAALAALAAAWRPVVLAARDSEDAPGWSDPCWAPGPANAASGASVRAPSAPRSRPGDPSADVFERFVAALGIKTSQRQWWGFEQDGNELRLAASGGAALAEGRAAAGAGLALERARAAGGGLVFDEPDARLSLHGDAASGIVVPMRLPLPERVRRGEIVTGFLAIESSRKRDFREADLERFARVGETYALALLIARFRTWSRERFGSDVHFDAEDASFRGFCAHLLAAARARVPVAFVGAAGTGKLVLARFLHFASARRDGPLAVAGGAHGAAPIEGWMRRASGGSLVLDHVERLPGELQDELLRRLEAGPPGADAPRLLATARAPLAEAVRAGRLRDELARSLERVQVRVPALAERRADIPALAAFLARRFADEEGVPAPRLADETAALLWRQPWEGNLCELEALACKLALLHPGELVRPGDVQAIADRYGIELVRRVPSRRPDRATLVAALRATCTAGGRPNKTRAALYLGWDPDTLVARLEEAGIDGRADPSHGPDGGWAPLAARGEPAAEA